MKSRNAYEVLQFGGFHDLMLRPGEDLFKLSDRYTSPPIGPETIGQLVRESRFMPLAYPEEIRDGGILFGPKGEIVTMPAVQAYVQARTNEDADEFKNSTAQFMQGVYERAIGQEFPSGLFQVLANKDGSMELTANLAQPIKLVKTGKRDDLDISVFCYEGQGSLDSKDERLAAPVLLAGLTNIGYYASGKDIAVQVYPRA